MPQPSILNWAVLVELISLALMSEQLVVWNYLHQSPAKFVPEALKAAILTWTNVSLGNWTQPCALTFAGRQRWHLPGSKDQSGFSGELPTRINNKCTVYLQLLYLNPSFLNKLSHPKCISQGKHAVSTYTNGIYLHETQLDTDVCRLLSQDHKEYQEDSCTSVCIQPHKNLGCTLEIKADTEHV